MTTQKMQGVFRPLAQVSSWAVVFVLLTATAAFPQQQKVPTPQSPTSQAVIQANERLAQLAGATSVKQSDYIIGSGDVLGIDVFDVPELSREVRVNETGYISLPLLPVKVQVAGLTSFQLQDKIGELLQSNGLVSAPQVTVSIKEQHSQPITIIGAVKTPMVIQAVRQTSLVQALSQAGGIADDAGNTVIVSRPAPSLPESEDSTAAPYAAADPDEAKTFVINISDLLETGDSRFNISIQGGDVISVPRAGIIYVVGAVNHPGGFVIQNDRDRMTALKMLSLAGGAIGTAKVKSAVILRKNADTGKRDEVPLDLDKVMKLKGDDVTLQASDILYIPDSSGKKALHRAGEVAIGLTSGVALVTATRY